MDFDDEQWGEWDKDLLSHHTKEDLEQAALRMQKVMKGNHSRKQVRRPSHPQRPMSGVTHGVATRHRTCLGMCLGCPLVRFCAGY